jgi:hypothetical protein
MSFAHHVRRIKVGVSACFPRHRLLSLNGCFTNSSVPWTTPPAFPDRPGRRGAAYRKHTSGMGTPGSVTTPFAFLLWRSARPATTTRFRPPVTSTPSKNARRRASLGAPRPGRRARSGTEPCGRCTTLPKQNGRRARSTGKARAASSMKVSSDVEGPTQFLGGRGLRSRAYVFL